MTAFLCAVAAEVEAIGRGLGALQDRIGDALSAPPAMTGAGSIPLETIVALQDLDRLTQSADALAQLLREAEPDPDEASWRRALDEMRLLSLRDRMIGVLNG